MRACSRPIPVLVYFALIIIIIYLIASRPQQVIVITPQRADPPSLPFNQPTEDLKQDPSFLVPRGRSFFYSDEYAQRLASFEVWRPRKLIQLSSLRENYWKKALYRKNSEGYGGVAALKENVFIMMITNSKTMWKNIPTQQQTLFRHFTHYGLYGNVADSIGGKEVINALSDTSPDIMENSKSFESYRILKAIRDSHANIGPEQVTLPDIPSLKKFTFLPALLKAYKDRHCEHDWFIITDDDTTILERNLREALSEFNPKEALYLGNAVKGPDYIFASSGSAIVLSKEAMRRAFDSSSYEVHKEDLHELVNDKYARITIDECCGDYMLAAFLKQQINLDLDIEKSSKLFQGLPITSVQLGANNWCNPVASFGSQRPRDMELVAEYEAVKEGSNEKILYGDIYLDFVKPYIYKTPQHNWDNGARDLELKPGSESIAYPEGHKTLEKCKEACLNIPDCTMLRYDAYKQYCGLGLSTVALGKPVLAYDASVDQGVCKAYGIQCVPRNSKQPISSMWFAQKIQTMRRKEACDILYKEPGGEGVENGSLDQTEGWWHRQKN